MKTYSVWQIISYLKSVLDSDLILGSVSVKGELSNFKAYPSGHLYFTLKDENASIKCVMFRQNALSLSFSPVNGNKVTIYGRVSVYEKSGDCQLYAQSMQKDGTGDLYAAFERLKQLLLAKGYFDESKKKPIPRFSRRIAVITSAQGAAVKDIIQISKRRNPRVKIIVRSVKVQGADAPLEISDAIREVNEWGLADCIIVGRGGGSYEDLQAFNDERVAKAVYDSKIPVISAVGHETDFTITDFVADLRAPTPSAAAELAVFDLYSVTAYAQNSKKRAYDAVSRSLSSYGRRLKTVKSRRVYKKPLEYIYMRAQHADTLIKRAEVTTVSRFKETKAKFLHLSAAAKHLSPFETVARGYALVQTANGAIIKNIADLPDSVKLLMRDGEAMAQITEVNHAKKETNL